MASGYDAVALPILEEIAAEVERRKLDEWEAPDVVAHPLTLLYRCLAKLDRSPERKEQIYTLICRLDPIQALACMK
jgi:type VI secretion system protein ImpA